MGHMTVGTEKLEVIEGVFATTIAFVLMMYLKYRVVFFTAAAANPAEGVCGLLFECSTCICFVTATRTCVCDTCSRNICTCARAGALYTEICFAAYGTGMTYTLIFAATLRRAVHFATFELDGATVHCFFAYCTCCIRLPLHIYSIYYRSTTRPHTCVYRAMYIAGDACVILLVYGAIRRRMA
jgi:hypothetical protein